MHFTYPNVQRNQWHGSHNYTLNLTDSIRMELSPEQYANLKASIDLVTQIETPLTGEQLDELMRGLGRKPT
jgi:hypothetical protein